MPSTKHVDNGNFAEICSLQHVREIRPMEFYGMIFLPVMLLSAFSFINICKEILQMLQQRIRYFMDGTNYLELTLYGSTAGFVVPFYMGYSMEFQWNLGALATLLAWMNFLLFFQRYEQTGIYVIMFLRIAKTLFRVISLFSILIFGFGLSFYIVLQYKPGEAWQNVPYSPTNDEHEYYVKFYSVVVKNCKIVSIIYVLVCLVISSLVTQIANGLQVDNYSAAWSNATAFISSCFPATYSQSKSLDADPNLDTWNHPVLAILKTLMMMLGEFDYVATFTSKLLDGDPRTNHFYVTNFLLLVLFIILMPILLMNLLIGLAVGDIETVQNDATLQRIRLQVEWFAELESKFPRRVLAFVDRIQWEVFQNSCQRSCFTRCVNWLKRRLCKRGDPESDYAALDEEHAGASCDFEKSSQDLLQQQQRQRRGQGDLMETLARQVEETQMKLKKMEAENTAQTQFLKMILAKMEIEVEEETDEGVDP
uniref:Ion_trans domain-containing protein n=2 Tax=Macrostomum lignano TaxID=282301 RepID=A0A1I8JFS6_9PLAT